MPSESLKQVLMRRDKLTEAEAEKAIVTAREELFNDMDNNDPDEILMSHFGLEPDYIFDLIGV